MIINPLNVEMNSRNSHDQDVGVAISTVLVLSATANIATFVRNVKDCCENTTSI